jgi:tetratricopeptide (TPR) repeat protein
MRAAAALEAATEKDSVSPGEVLPAIELLGDMLLDTNDDEAALAAYQQSLQRTPGRLNSLYGAARAAERSGKSDEARLYYTALMEALGEREERPEMVAAASSHLRTG